MTKITTDFVGSETIAVTKQRLTDILAYWGSSTAAYTTWGQARTALNARLINTTAGVIGSTELAGSFLPKINFLNDPDDMIADALFGASEQGVWLDPSDVANVAWRRNLLTYTEQFDASDWLKYQVSVTGNSSIAPDGSTTGDKLVETTATDTHIVYRAATALTAASYTLTVYAKAAERSIIYMRLDTSSAKYAYFDLSGGTVLSANAAYVATITSAGSGWYRCSITTTASSANHDIVFGLTTANNVAVYAGTAGNGVLIWGAQLELGTVATDYQRITDLNTEVIARFPSATMYQDAAGTTPVYAPGQPVGLRLDKSKGLVLGAELVSNGTFVSGTTGWTAVSGSIAAVSGRGVVTNSGAPSALVSTPVTTVVGKYYKVSAVAQNQTVDSNSRLYVGATAGGTTVAVDQTEIGDTSENTLSVIFLAVGTTTYITLANRAITDASSAFDNISVKELPGNHATQSVLGSRPTYGIEPAGGRRNLLTFSEQFDVTAAWFNGLSSVTANTVAAPDGTLTADTLSFSAAANANLQMAAALAVTAGQQYTYSVYVRAASAVSNVNISLNGSDAAISVTTSWQRVTRTVTASGATLNPTLVTRNAVAANIFIWGAQLELGSTATAYQRVTTAFDVTEAGVNTCHYCQYDGSDDGMVTNSIDFSGTDKMSVFAGVRKLSDAAVGVVVELGSGDQNGSILITAPRSGGVGNYRFISKGTAFADAFPSGGYTAPISNVFAGIGDIAGDIATIRLNGVQAAQTTTDQGTGNYGNYPLYLGRRGGTSLPFNGRDYGIIVTGKLANATAIASTEMYLAQKTGVVI